MVVTAVTENGGAQSLSVLGLGLLELIVCVVLKSTRTVTEVGARVGG